MSIEQTIRKAVDTLREMGLTPKEINLSDSDYKELNNVITTQIIGVDPIVGFPQIQSINISSWNGIQVFCALPDNPEHPVLEDSFIVGVPPSQPFKTAKERIFSLKTGEELV